MTDGPLIVQSDKTLLLEVDHERAVRLPQGDRAVRRARAVPGAHPHLPAHARWGCGTPAPPATTPSRSSTRCCPTRATRSPHALLVDVAETMARYGRLRAGEAPGARARPGLHRPAGARGGPARQEGRRDARRARRRRHRRRARLRARQPQAGAAQARLAGRGPRRLRRRRGARDRPARGRLAPARLPARRRRVVLARRLGRRRAPVRRRQDDRRRGRDGAGAGHDADPRHQHRERPAVEGRAAAAHVADRGRDRRVLRRASRRSGRSRSRRTR